MDSFAQDVKSALRQLRRAPAVAAIVIATVGIGVGANTAIFSVVRGVLLRPLPYHEPDHLVRLFGQWRSFGAGAVSLPEFRDYQRSLKTVAQLAAWQYQEGNLAGAGGPEHVRIAQSTASLMPLLGIAPEAGRNFSREEEGAGKPRIALLSHELWKRRFAGDPAVIGKSAMLDDEPVQIIGVLPPEASIAPAGSKYDRPAIDLFMPLAFPASQETEQRRSNHNLRVAARLVPGATLASLRAELSLLTDQFNILHPVNYPKEAGFSIGAVKIDDDVVGGVRDSLWMLLAAVGVVLLIACANVANLLLLRATARERELAVRAALGANRRRLIRQLLIESVVLALAGGALGIVLAAWSLDALVALASASLPHAAEVRIDLPVLAFALGLAALTGVLFGIAPALSTRHLDLHESLSGAPRASSAPRPQRLRRALVVCEVALALVLLAGGGVSLRSFSRVLSVTPGFRADGVVAMRVALPRPLGHHAPPAEVAAWDARVRGFWSRALQRLRALPGVDAAGAIQVLPLSGVVNDQIVEIEGRDVSSGATPPDEEIRAVLPGFFEAMGIPLLRGRTVQAGDTAHAPAAVVINQAFAQKYWPGQDAVGKRLRPYNAPIDEPNTGEWATVVGVVGDVHEVGLDADAKPIMYFPEEQTGSATAALSLVVHAGGSVEALAAAARAALRELDPALPVFDVRPMSQMLDGSLAQRRFALVLLESFAALALLLAALGLYGVMAWSVAQRTREIGVRMALGARSADVVALIARESAKLVGAGVAIGALGAFAATRLLTGLLYRTSPADPLGFTGATLLLVAVAALAACLPARAAARVTPMTALRAE